MPLIIWILSVVLLSASFAAILVFAKLFTKPFDEENFSFLRVFPFEVIKNSPKEGIFYSISSYVFAIMCFSPILLVIENTSSFKDLNQISIIISSILCLAGVAFVFLSTFEVVHVKTHLILFTISVFFILLSGALITTRAYIAYSACNKYGRKEPLLFVDGIFGLISVLATLVLVFNPKLFNWAKLEKVQGQENTYKRPKRFALAYSEWGLLVLLYANELIFFVQLLVK